MDSLAQQQQVKYYNKYRTLLYRWKNGEVHHPEHKIFEMVYALYLNHVLWDDLPPDFGDRFQLPHMRDFGVDTLSWTYDQTCQVKHYTSSSLIKWSDFTNFTAYTKDVLNLTNMCIGTTPDARMDRMAQHCCTKNNITVHRHTLTTLLDRALDKYEPDNKRTTPTMIIEPREYLLNAYHTIETSKKAVLKLQLPCGTGKSYIMLYTMVQRLATHPDSMFCVFCPWVDLAKQLRDLFASQLNVLFIGDTTQTKTIIDQPFQVVVCVNPSVSHVPPKEYTIKFYDEAHHLEDRNGSMRKQLDQITSQQTVLLSATYHEFDDIDFDYPMRQAIDDGYISDYVLHFEYFTSGDRTHGLCDMIVEHPEWFPMLVYFNSTQACVDFQTVLHTHHVRSEYLIGTDNANKRNRIREQLEQNTLSVLCLCGCYNEGVSIDTIQTVVFGELRHSPVNKIQIAMRANRKHHSKPFYRVVLPVTQKDIEGKDVRELVETFARIDPVIQQVFSLKKRDTSRLRIGIRQGTTMCDGDVVDAEFLYEEIYDRCGEMVKGRTFEEWKGVLFEYCDMFGKVPQAKDQYRDCNIGNWMHAQKGKITSHQDTLYIQLAQHPLIKINLDY